MPARYVLAVLGSIGMAIVYGLKVNLSVAMVAMLNHTAVGHGSHGGGAGQTLSNLTEESDVEICLPPGGADANATATTAAVIRSQDLILWNFSNILLLLFCLGWSLHMERTLAGHLAKLLFLGLFGLSNSRRPCG